MKSCLRRSSNFNEADHQAIKKQVSFDSNLIDRSSAIKPQFKLASSVKYEKVLSNMISSNQLRNEIFKSLATEDEKSKQSTNALSSKAEYDSYFYEDPRNISHTKPRASPNTAKERKLSAVRRNRVASTLVNKSRRFTKSPNESRYRYCPRPRINSENAASQALRENISNCLATDKNGCLQNRTFRGSLKKCIQAANSTFVSKLQEQYEESDPKHTEIAPRLATLYIEGKRCSQDYEKALNILKRSSLLQSKYLLAKLAFLEKRYEDVYHYSELYIPKKCSCRADSSKGKRSSVKESPNRAIKILEQEKPECYVHRLEDIKRQIVLSVGEKEAARLQKVGSKMSHNPKGSKPLA